MTNPDYTDRSWLVEVVPDEVRMRCSYRRLHQRIIKFTAQLEVFHSDQWKPIVRYDNAHGFCHRDTIHADGSQDKTPVYFGSANDTFTRAIDDLRLHWQSHHARFLREVEP